LKLRWSGATFEAPVIIRHYGPVFTLGGAPLQVCARPLGAFPWRHYSSAFSYTVSSTESRCKVSIEKKPAGSLGWRAGYEYRITPVTDINNANALRCLDVTGKPAVRAYEHRFTISRQASGEE